MHTKSHLRATNISGIVNFRCNTGTCQKGFTKHNALLIHQRLHDNNLFNCYFCKWRGLPQQFWIHMNRHYHVKPFECSFCRVRFYQKHTLKEHEECFHEIILDRYKCDFCDYKTYSANGLKWHKKRKHPII